MALAVPDQGSVHGASGEQHHHSVPAPPLAMPSLPLQHGHQGLAPASLAALPAQAAMVQPSPAAPHPMASQFGPELGQQRQYNEGLGDRLQASMEALQPDCMTPVTQASMSPLPGCGQQLPPPPFCGGAQHQQHQLQRPMQHSMQPLLSPSFAGVSPSTVQQWQFSQGQPQQLQPCGVPDMSRHSLLHPPWGWGWLIRSVSRDTQCAQHSLRPHLRQRLHQRRPCCLPPPRCRQALPQNLLRTLTVLPSGAAARTAGSASPGLTPSK